MKCIVVTPDKEIFSGEVNTVIVPGIEGELGIFENHVPLVTLLSSGRLQVFSDNGNHEYQIEGGFVEVRSNVISVITDKIVD